MIENETYTGAVRKIYEGRTIILPKEICNKTGIFIGDIVETDTGKIILRPYDPCKRIREKIKKADKVLQTLNSRIKIIVFNKDVEIYSCDQQTTVPINNFKIKQAMNKDIIDEDALNNEILYLFPHGSLSVDQEEATAIVITTSMGQEADTIIFDYLWKIIKD